MRCGKRRGDIPVRVLRAGKSRWLLGHAIWISVFAWRGSPAAWSEDLVQVVTVTVGVAGPEERKHLHRLGDDPVVATMIAVVVVMAAIFLCGLVAARLRERT